MPIEIKELHVRVTVDATPPGASGPSGTPAPGAGGDATREAIVAECVEQVVALLKQKSER